MNKKVKTFHANMQKNYIERADQNGAPQQKSNDNQVMPSDFCIGIIEGNKDLSVNDDEMMDLANCHQKETAQDVKLEPELTETQQKEMMIILSRPEKVFRIF